MQSEMVAFFILFIGIESTLRKRSRVATPFLGDDNSKDFADLLSILRVGSVEVILAEEEQGIRMFFLQLVKLLDRCRNLFEFDLLSLGVVLLKFLQSADLRFKAFDGLIGQTSK